MSSSLPLPSLPAAAAAVPLSEPIKAASSLSEVEETVARLSSHKGVSAVLILQGTNIIQSTLTDDAVVEKSALLLKIKSFAVDLLDGDLQFIRLCAKHEEILMAPHGEYILVVWHNPQLSGM